MILTETFSMYGQADKIILVDGSASVNLNMKFHNGMNFTKIVAVSTNQTLRKHLMYQTMNLMLM
jgi:hypothetical protein